MFIPPTPQLDKAPHSLMPCVMHSIKGTHLDQLKTRINSLTLYILPGGSIAFPTGIIDAFYGVSMSPEQA